jgi:2,3,4,5-tetrahydropyridine-2,6-dicarboxylate N-succinyltransferase
MTMSNAALEAAIEAAWEARDTITPATPGETRDAIEATLDALDRAAAGGRARADGTGTSTSGPRRRCCWASACTTWSRMRRAAGRRLVGQGRFSKFKGWGPRTEWKAAGFRAVPNCVVRRSAYIAPGVVLMPSFVNLGAYVDEGTMVDTWATVGSCAQIGKNVHLSGGVGIGGVLEPMQAGPTIIEDNCFIGARSEVVEGVIVREGSVLGMGVFIGQSTKIVDRATGEVMYGEVPAGSVVVAGSMPSTGGVHLYCAVIVKRVDADPLQDLDQRAAARLRRLPYRCGAPPHAAAPDVAPSHTPRSRPSRGPGPHRARPA